MEGSYEKWNLIHPKFVKFVMMKHLMENLTSTTLEQSVVTVAKTSLEELFKTKAEMT